MNNDDAIYINNLTKVYHLGGKSGSFAEPKLALDGLNLCIKTGTIFGLLGPNGAGKSTLINILAGTVLKSSGDVRILGVDIDADPKRARSLIGVVPQEIAVDTFFPVWQALEFTAGYFGIRPAQRITDHLLKSLSLQDKKNSLPQRLSGGMKRRFLMAKAMVHSPRILVLDEPTAGVDIELRDQLWEYVKKLNRDKGITVIITTHYLTEAQELCNEIAFINNGKIIKQAPKDKLLLELGSRYLDVEFEGDPDFEMMEKYKEQQYKNLQYQALGEHKIRFNLQSWHKNQNGQQVSASKEMEGSEFNQILGLLQAMNLHIKDLRLNEPDLEDLFYKIIKA